MRAGRTAVTVAVAASLLGLLVGTARADVTPPADPSPSPSPTDVVTPVPDVSTTPPPAVDPTPTPSDSVPPPPLPTTSDGPVVWPSTEPTPSIPAPAGAADAVPLTQPAVGAPDARATGSSSVPATSTASPTPATALVPGPPSDGVAPGAGQVDEYLALSAQREAAVTAAGQLAAGATAAHAAVLGLEAEQAVLSTQSDIDRYVVASTQSDADAVASQMYQQGDGGLGAIASIIGGGPDSFLARLDTFRMVHASANGVVRDAMSARLDLALVVAQLQAVDARLATARLADTTAATAAARSRAELASIDARLAELDVVAPQVSVGPDGCPTQDVPATLRDGSDVVGAATLCRQAVKQAATPQAALAITWAFQHLGASYACGGAGRLLPFRADCSSFVSRAYHEGAGLATAGDGWAPSTRNMVPWDGVALDPHYGYVAPPALRAGDLVLYDTCPQGGCPYKHVVMYLGSPDGGKSFWMIHTNACGDVAKVETFWGFPSSGHPFLVARRVLALPGETVTVPTPVQARARAVAAQSLATEPRVG
jgi:cell wall-associated NlpC family hydrolase